MKLNLLPKTVRKDVQSKSVFTIMLIAVLGSLVLAFMYNRKLVGDLESFKSEAALLQPEADKVVRASQRADQIIADAKIVLTNTQLVADMDAATDRYPELYDLVKQYIPSFFRVRSISATSSGASGCTISINGYLKTFQQYSDVMIALLRIPGAVAVGRSGFAPVAPDDEGPFGYSPEIADRGPIPGWSNVTLTVQMEFGLQAPDPLATLTSAASGGGAPQPGGAP
ncbi:MAG: hypothetical protein HND42_06050, partial [Armatimonadetes bacterium]|nr:hypothetical protein [Armatimonadota bacterium]NOG92789.1 hypothetical protein [Armatimonadota bacterium]